VTFTPTQAYARYKSQSDALLDFAVLVSYSVPALRSEIQMVGAGTLAALPAPDFFHKSNKTPPADLLKTEAHYEQYLASYVLIAHFSFFESFIDNLIREMIAFHGGEDKFVARIENRLKRFLKQQSGDSMKTKRKLQDAERPKYRDSYRKHSRNLDEEGCRFPGELFAAFGVRSLISKMENFKAVHIPDTLMGTFQLDLSEAEVRRFHEIRELRNSIAHGDPVNVTMKQAVVMNGSLRALAVKISAHIADHFFVIEKYVPGNPFSA
jgi:hypothetical protein